MSKKKLTTDESVETAPAVKENSVTRADLIGEARKYVGTPFGHQGRTRRAMDCGGLILVVAGNLNLSALEELGYASFPTNGRFEELLTAHADDLHIESRFPHKFDGTEFRPADVLSFDYGRNKEGTRHIAFVTRWDQESKCYWIIEANNRYGVCEFPLRHPFSQATVHGWSVRGLAD